MDGKLSISIHQKETNKFMYIPFRSFHQKHTIKNIVWGELKRYMRYNTEEKIFKKLRCQFFHRLRNRGFKKYVLSKLFQHVTYSQRDKLLNTELPLPNVCEPLTIQEAETRIILDGEAAYICRKGTRQLPITSIQISAPAIPSTQTTASSTATAQSPKGTRESSATIKGALQLKVEFLFVKLPDYFILKIWQNAKNIFYNMNLSFFSELQKTKPKQRLCLVLPGWIYAKGETVVGPLSEENFGKILQQIQEIC